ncbi:MAG: protein kinase [Bacteroidetes Order II. Incertae sedis bacterium]|nr:protein kinase [Bacteroidetes Order II. bacterium]
MAKTVLAQNFGRYQLLEPIGQGGMGTVYRAYDPLLDRSVALKRLSPDLVSDPALLARFEQESRLMAQVHHPQIATVFDAGDVGGQPFLTMALVQGEPLHRFAASRPRAFTLQQAIVWGKQVANALAALHEKGILHRDLKPDNLIRTPDNQLVLTDFGIAIRTTERQTSRVFEGTPEYASPEQFSGEEPSQASDVYSLGALLFWMLAGRPPFEGDSFEALQRAVLSYPAPDIRLWRKDIPESVSILIQRCLEKDPAKRFETALAVEQALEDLSVPTAKFRPWLAVVVLTVAGILGWWFWSEMGGQQGAQAWLREGQAQFSAGKAQEAAKTWEKAARLGNREAMRSLGILYAEVLNKPTQAEKWFQEAAKRGDVVSMRGLGTLYYNGKSGIPRNTVRACSFFEAAAREGDAESVCYRGVLRYNGECGNAPDTTMGIRDIRLAAGAGVVKCALALKALRAEE